MVTLTISLPGTSPRDSTVTIGVGLMSRVPEQLRSVLENRSIYWIWDSRVWELWHKRLASLGWPLVNARGLIHFDACEANKRLSAIEDLARRLVKAGADRGSVLVAVGGGVTGDVAGFLASIYMRGIPHIQIPTTLLAQVDSSVGGKTGVDLPEGKNLLGAFHQPTAVWIDPQFVETLPPREFRQGMAEVIKMALLGDEALWNHLQDHAQEIKQAGSAALTHTIASCCRLKASVVAADEKEAGHRRVLNLGHTVGHALERLTDYQMLHGDAVAIGLNSAARLAVRLGWFSHETLMRLEELCREWQLPTRLPPEFTPDAILSAIKSDKKCLDGKLHFILPLRIGAVIERSDLDMEELKGVLQEQQGS